MESRKRKRKERIEIEVGESITIRGKDFTLTYKPGNGLTYKGDLAKVNKAIELYHMLRNEMGLEQYKIGDALRIEQEEAQEEVQ
ncbi:MAG: hypothetical protein C0177_06435 [Fervidicoccus fontis]|nr:MAG: hypothetical protein C0177_06435 [Fervidicoccus fontis]